MKDIKIVEKNTMCVSGHRKLYGGIDSGKIEKIFIEKIESGYDTFLIGMAVGFDTVCFKILEKLREQYKIRIIACVPCLEQDKMFTLAQKKEYRRMIETADEKIVLSENYTPYCMIKRNKFMVDNSSALLIYLREKKGGTYNTYLYAEKQQKQIVEI